MSPPAYFHITQIKCNDPRLFLILCDLVIVLRALHYLLHYSRRTITYGSVIYVAMTQPIIVVQCLSNKNASKDLHFWTSLITSSYVIHNM
jgi:hypothetical protein